MSSTNTSKGLPSWQWNIILEALSLIFNDYFFIFGALQVAFFGVKATILYHITWLKSRGFAREERTIPIHPRGGTADDPP
jgi:hypothetical protein